MASSSTPMPDLMTDTGVKATWEEFLSLVARLYEKGKFYYH